MSDAPRRIDMTAELTVRPRVMMQGLRRPTSTDIEPLGELMHAAYAGTVDDHGASADEALREIAAFFEIQAGTQTIQNDVDRFGYGHPFLRDVPVFDSSARNYHRLASAFKE
mgnify:CR=1 FL=1